LDGFSFILATWQIAVIPITCPSAEHPEAAAASLDAAEKAACMLWQALDGIDARRHAMAVA
jgi:hypothetical protein